jgi:hypothetical protein
MMDSEEQRHLLAVVETLKASSRSMADAITHLNAEVSDLRGQLDAARSRELHLIDAIAICAVRANMPAEELAQLGVAQLVKGENGEPDGVSWYTLDDLVVASSFAMKQQATVAKFRQLKDHFVVHQRAVTAILDKLQELSRRNYLTATDLRDVQALREDLAHLIKRKI